MAKYTPEKEAAIFREKVLLFNSVRSFKRQYIGNGPLGSVRVPLGVAVGYLMSNWGQMDPLLRVRAVQKMRNRQFIQD